MRRSARARLSAHVGAVENVSEMVKEALALQGEDILNRDAEMLRDLQGDYR